MIPLVVPQITEPDIAAVVAVLRSGQLVQGRNVARLEQQMSARCGVAESIAAANGTATLHLALAALGIGSRDEVIVPSFSFIATANAVELAGATPVFVDIDERTFNIDPSKVEEAITPRTRAVMPVHEFGLTADMDVVMDIARRHNLVVIEDAACALGATDFGRPAGSIGNVGSFSLHPRKAVTSGEGGILTTNDTSLAERARILRNHGIRMVDGQMDFIAAGFNYRLTDFQAALVVGQLARLDEQLAAKQRIAAIYFNEIRNPLVTLPYVPPGKFHSWQTFHILLDDCLDQNKVLTALRTRGVGCSHGAQCLPAQTYYHDKYGGDARRKHPNGWRAWKQGAAIPLYSQLTEREVCTIADAVNRVAA